MSTLVTRPRGCDHPCGAHAGAGSLSATAPPNARAWLLIEHPGPWPDLRSGLDLLPAPIVHAFHRAKLHGVRPQLVRRPGERSRRGEDLVVMAGWSAGADPWLHRRTVRDLAELDAVDVEALGRGRRPGGPEAGPVFLVCTNARRNPCCSRIGLPIARALALRFPGRIWETSHVGGDGHAPNLVCLPHGLYYGGQSVDTAIAAVEAYRNGRIAFGRFRGRCGIPGPLQAAEHFVRAHTRETALDEVVVWSPASDPAAPAGAVTHALARADGAYWRVVVERVTRSPECCGECDAQTAYRLVELGPAHRAARDLLAAS